ncbi:MAG: stage IV sporulation protein A [Clostridia bacterium]|nr:stage IV sporulation protein A [Clostridia bacterium]
MEKFGVYSDISNRTGGDIYIGVVGPVRTGKSTFVSKFMEKLVIPNINSKFSKQIATDEMPQSADGKTVMTTEPKFVPANSVKVSLNNKCNANFRLVDCVGYFVDGALGATDGDTPRMVKTPWSDKEIPFESAAEIGTKKVINNYSTIGVLVTTDGSFGSLKRDDYLLAEEKAVNDLKKCNKPFVVVLNSSSPQGASAVSLRNKLEEKYGVSVVCVNVLSITEKEINDIMDKVLMEFPVSGFDIKIPKWMQALPENNPLISKITSSVKSASMGMNKMKDVSSLSELFNDDEDFNSLEVEKINMGDGMSVCSLKPKEGLFYKALSNECGEEISDDYSLMTFVKEFSGEKRKFEKIKDALNSAEKDGYGIVVPTLDEMVLDQPVLVKQSGKYGVKLKATAPSLHIMKVDVATEISPIVGTEQQGQDYVDFLTSKFEKNPNEIWETNMLGKSLYDMVSDGLVGKINNMPTEAQGKMRKTVTKIVNEGKGGVICILL